MASLDGHHVPGTSTTYKHGWIKVGMAAKLEDYKKSGGFSRDMNSGEPTEGFMVSKAGTESIIPKEDFDVDGERYIRAHAEAHSKELSKPGAYQGAWTDDGSVYLDVSHNYTSEIEAARQAVRNKQIAIGDVAKIKAEDWDNAFPTTHDFVQRVAKDIIRQKGSTVNLSILTPSSTPEAIDDIMLSKSGRVAFWKQILPQGRINYTAKDGSRQVLDFDEKYLTDLASSSAVDKCGFLLADKDNAHTMDPERWRGEVAKFEYRGADGLWGKIVFPSTDAAKAVLDNPALGVSARIRENIQRSDGTTVPRGIIHVLGTLDPQVSGMSDWQTADLSKSGDTVLDLTNEKYEEPDMAQKNKTEQKSLKDFSEADIDKMTDEELDEFLDVYAPEFAGSLDEDVTDESDEDEDEDEDHEDKAAATKQELVGAGADMSKVQQDIELANSQAAYATSRANDALGRLAAAEWKAAESEYLGAGVPPHLLDLAKPVLARSDDMVIDLSNTDDEDINVSAVVRGLLDACKGMVDLSNESGHLGTYEGEDDPDQPILDAWEV